MAPTCCHSIREKRETAGQALVPECAKARVAGLTCAKALRAFQVGKARTSHDGPWSRMRRSRGASAQPSRPACPLTKASASAVT
jgi:hypothetical protein